MILIVIVVAVATMVVIMIVVMMVAATQMNRSIGCSSSCCRGGRLGRCAPLCDQVRLRLIRPMSDESTMGIENRGVETAISYFS